MTILRPAQPAAAAEVSATSVPPVRPLEAGERTAAADAERPRRQTVAAVARRPGAGPEPHLAAERRDAVLLPASAGPVVHLRSARHLLFDTLLDCHANHPQRWAAGS